MPVMSVCSARKYLSHIFEPNNIRFLLQNTKDVGEHWVAFADFRSEPKHICTFFFFVYVSTSVHSQRPGMSFNRYNVVCTRVEHKLRTRMMINQQHTLGT